MSESHSKFGYNEPKSSPLNEMIMPQKSIANGAGYKQQFPNSCWAACARYMWNAYIGNPLQQINSDVDLAHVVGLHVDSEADIRDVLRTLNIYGGNDSEHVPTFDEIVAEIDSDTMLCVNVGPVRHGYRDRTPMVGGHYLVIVGYNTNGSLLQVMDPATGHTQWVVYNAHTYQNEDGHISYYCGTAYGKSELKK